METKPAQNIQDTFLNTVRKDKTHHGLSGQRCQAYRKDPFLRQVLCAFGEQ